MACPFRVNWAVSLERAFGSPLSSVSVAPPGPNRAAPSASMRKRGADVG
jgi:hypothetical protein